VRVTNRPGTAVGAKEPYFQGVELPEVVRRHEFDVTVPESWAGLPDPASLRAVVITFPMQLASVEPFWEAFLRRVPSVVAFSSTSVYQVDVPGQTVDEGTQIKATPRAMAEAYMQERGAAVLTISGIFGEPRGPRGVCTCLAFYSSGGGGLNGAKSVNMVHVRDIIEATERCAPPAPSPAPTSPPPGPTSPARRRSRLTPLARAPPSQLHRQPAAGAARQRRRYALLPARAHRALRPPDGARGARHRPVVEAHQFGVPVLGGDPGLLVHRAV